MSLKVKPIKKKHAQRGLAIIDQVTMNDLGIQNGDYIAVINPDTENEAVARAWPGLDEDDDDGIIRIDGIIRKKVGIGIDDSVEIEKRNIEPADSIEVSISDQFSIRGDISGILRSELSGQPVTVGDSIPFSLSVEVDNSSPLKLEISNTEPNDTVVVTDETSINIVKKSPDEFSEGAGVQRVTYEDIGGLDHELEQVREMIELPMRHPEIFGRLGIEPPKGVLLHGPPGTGKTLIARAVANEIDADFYSISGPEIMSKYYGESEEQLREVFEQAEENSPAIIFMDELDSIAAERGEASGDVERRVVAQLLSLMDGLEDRNEVVVIGATNRVDAIDPALRRGGRFDREIEITAPDKEGRREIFDVHTRQMPLSDSVNLDEYAERTHGFVGADIEALCKESAMTALRRNKPDLDLSKDEIDAEVLQDMEVIKDDIDQAMRDIEPSALREVFVEVPDVTWDDIGGLYETKKRLKEVVQWPLNYEDVFDDMSLDPAKGLLLYGPPGTGKTLLAKAVSNESESNFISIKGPELLNKYVGESEKGVREIFEKARSNAPTIVFFDEIDALAAERGSGAGGDSNVGERVVSQLLTELDGLENLDDVIVIATTNRPDLIDSALLRPGRLDRHIHVPVPDKDARRSILDVHTKDVPLSDDVDLDIIAQRTEGFVGADIEALIREATMESTRSLIDDLDPDADTYERTKKEVNMDHFEVALDEVNPSVTEETKEDYEQIEEDFERNQVTQKDKSRIGFQ